MASTVERNQKLEQQVLSIQEVLSYSIINNQCHIFLTETTYGTENAPKTADNWYDTSFGLQK